MESAICLRYCPFPYGSKGLQAARPSRFHLKFNHATTFYVPQFSTTTHSVTRSIKHANCMLERFSVPSENERKSGNKILRGVTAVSLVLACVLGLFNFRGKMNPKFNTAYACLPLGFHKPDADGRSALESVLVITSNAEPSTDQNQPAPELPGENYVKNLKLLAIRKSKSKEGGDALDRLRNYYKIYTEYKNNTQAKEYIEVALVEVLMFQGKYEQARELLDQQIDELFRKKGDTKKPKWDKNNLLKRYRSEENNNLKFGIAQRILYKAIVHTMLGHDKKAKEWWQAFISLPPVTPEKGKMKTNFRF